MMPITSPIGTHNPTLPVAAPMTAPNTIPMATPRLLPMVIGLPNLLNTSRNVVIADPCLTNQLNLTIPTSLALAIRTEGIMVKH